MRNTLFLFLVFASFIGCQTSVPNSVDFQTISPSQTPTPAAAIDPSKTFDPDVLIPWKAQIGGTEYRWDGKDLFVKRARAKVIRVFSRAASKYKASFPSEKGRCDLSSFFIPVAVVADMVSYEHESGFNCGTESGEWRYATVNMAKSTRPLDLRTFFSDNQLLQAFLANPQLSTDIQKAVFQMKIDAVPSTLPQLSAFLTKYDYQIFNGDSYFEPDYLTRFTFHHLEGDTVCVRVSATSTSTSGRAIHDYAEIYLPISDGLRDSLQKADSGEQGFLMKDYETKVGTAPATFDSRF